MNKEEAFLKEDEEQPLISSEIDLVPDDFTNTDLVKSDSSKNCRIQIPFIGSIELNKKFLNLILCILIFVILLNVETFSDPHKKKCFALLIFSSVLWATEAIPLFVTSLMIPFLIVAFGILKDQDGDSMNADDASKLLFGKMLSPMIFLLLGGFSIAAALSKHHIAKILATFVLSKAGSNSKIILLTIIFVATFSSMWLSNVAAPVLCFSIIQPILKTLEPGNKFARSLVMGIALGSNIGGMVTPLSSPQNTIAIGQMDTPVSWIKWLSITIPISILSILICWVMLIFIYKPHHSTPRVAPIRAFSQKFTFIQIFITIVTIISIGLWCADSALKPVFGNSGVIALFPMIMFFGFNVLSKDDFNSFLWTVIILAMGGSALGESIKNTSLLATIANGITGLLEGQSIWVVNTAFCGLLLFVATFISHTVSAIIVLPIVKTIGKDTPHVSLLIMGSMLMCSGAMGLPISGFPNINAVALEDPTGKPYVKTKDFLKVGVPLSIVVFLLVISVGFGLMLILGL